jgi:hypothetical protein
VVAGDEIGEPGRGSGGCDERVEIVLGQCGVDPLVAGEAPARGQGVQVRRVAQAAAALRLLEELLSEPRHLLARVALVPSDHLRERRDRRIRRELRQPRRQAGLQLVQQDLELGLRQALRLIHGHGVDEHRASRRERREGLFDHGVDAGMASELRANDAEARGREAFGVGGARVVRRRGACRGRVARVGPGHRVQQPRCIGDAARHRPRRVLGVRDRDDAVATDEPDGRLQPDQPVGGCRRDDRTVGLGPDRRGGEVRCDRCR